WRYSRFSLKQQRILAHDPEEYLRHILSVLPE
ncbi:hypothetical protein, partial [Escherichia coli]